MQISKEKKKHFVALYAADINKFCVLIETIYTRIN